jgi:hypothetical protein
MRREDMINFFDHIGNRQTSHGIRDAFRFKAVLSSRKKGDLGGAKYRDPAQTSTFNMGAMNDPAQTTAQNVGVINDTAPGVMNDTAPGVMNDTAPGVMNDTAPGVMNDTAPGAMNDTAPDDPPQKKRPRPKPKPKGKAKNTAAEDNRNLDSPAPTRSRPKPRPTGKAKEMQVDHSNNGITSVPVLEEPRQTLTFDPEYRWDTAIVLDHALDPAFDAPAVENGNEIFTHWSTGLLTPNSNLALTPESFNRGLTMPDTATESFTPQPQQWMPDIAPVSISPQPQQLMPYTAPDSFSQGQPTRSPRRKGKNADLLAMEEAKKLKAKNKSRR